MIVLGVICVLIVVCVLVGAAVAYILTKKTEVSIYHSLMKYHDDYLSQKDKP